MCTDVTRGFSITMVSILLGHETSFRTLVFLGGPREIEFSLQVRCGITCISQVSFRLLCHLLQTCEFYRGSDAVFTEKCRSSWSQIQLNPKISTQHIHRLWIRVPDFVTEALPLVSLTFGSKRGTTIHTKVVVGLHIGASVLGKRYTDIRNLYCIMQSTLREW